MKLSRTVQNMQKIGEEACKRKSSLKHNPTVAEIKIQEILKKYKIPFSFQKIVYTPRNYFIVDFLIYTKPKKIVEIDGNSHNNNKSYDKL